MIKLSWHTNEVPKEMKIKQVYGLVFSEDGRMLVRIEYFGDKKVFSLAGGKPEVFDKDRTETLRREFLEEVNTTLKKDIIYVGYQEVDEEDGNPPYAQVRMTAIIDKIKIKQPDPDNGKTYDRLLTTPQKAITLLNWGEIGKLEIEEAYRIAKEKFKFKTISKVDSYV